MMGRVGQDVFGRTLVADLETAGVDVSGVTVDPTNGSSMSVAILQDDGEYGAVIVSGSNLTIDTREMESKWSGLGGGKVLMLQNEAPHAVNAPITKVARSGR